MYTVVLESDDPDLLETSRVAMAVREGMVEMTVNMARPGALCCLPVELRARVVAISDP